VEGAQAVIITSLVEVRCASYVVSLDAVKLDQTMLAKTDAGARLLTYKLSLMPDI
jgi:hypothetical protein